MLSTSTIPALLVGLAAVTGCQAVGQIQQGARTNILRPGDVAEWNVTGTAPFNFEVHQLYGPTGPSGDLQTRYLWENNTVAVGTTNTTIRWTIPDRSYGNWSIKPYVQDSSDDRAWNSWLEEIVAVTSGSPSMRPANFAMAAFCIATGISVAVV